MALLNTSLLKQLLPKKLIGPASLSYGNKKKKKNQNRNTSYYIFNTQSQPERYTSDIDNMDNRSASIYL